MSKKRIADSIIIKVGGGIREVSREPAEIAAGLEPAGREPAIEPAEDVHSVKSDLGPAPGIEIDNSFNQ